MDNLTWPSTESDVTSLIQTKIGISKFKLFLNLGFLLIATVSILGNSVALRVISCSQDIRSCKSYILFINQCLMDGIYGAMTFFCIICEYSIRNRGMNSSAIDWFLCSIIHSDVLMAIPSCGSAYNLAAMSAERMISVIFPVFHRNPINNKVMIGIAVSAWIVGLLTMLPLCVISNGVDPTGTCYYWNAMGMYYRMTISIAMNSSLSVIPFLLMFISYLAMFIRIAIMKLKVRLAVIKVLASCVFVFFVCHLPRNVFSILSLTTDKGIMWFRDPVYVIALVMVQFTAIMNPIVYVVQYKDYRVE